MLVIGASYNYYYLIGGFVVLAIAYRVWRVFYDLYLHPLARIPGPKLAAITYLYQTYYSLVGGSRFYIQIGKLHNKYGPVVRITPDEVHLSDPENYDVIYHMGTKYSKVELYYKAMGGGYSSFTTMSNEEHRIKRSRLSPFFSRKKVLELEDSVQRNAEKLCALLEKKFSLNESVDLHHGFRALSVDIITDYAFNQCYDLLDSPDLGKHFFHMIEGLGPMMWVFQQWPALQKIALSLPKSVASALSPSLKHLFNIQEHCWQQIISVKADMETGRKSEARRTIFHELLTADPKAGYIVPPLEHLKDETFVVLGASSDTTGNAMTVATYEVISNPKMYRRLTAELKEAFPDANARLNFTDLEKLSYLTGVIKEGIRLSFGSPGRLPRVVPEGGATFNGYYLPAGSFVSMGTWDLHRNEEYFSDAEKFDPDRWSSSKRLDKAYVPFGRGSRMCVGMNLAYCELYVVLGTLFRRFDNMKPNHLTAEDRVYDDYISACNPHEATKFHVSKGEVA